MLQNNEKTAEVLMAEKIVEQAKSLLMEREGLSEEEAHHQLQKRSMDSGARLVQTARRILREYERP